jgi:holo-[acyl-carrier protein] synthase
VDDVAESLARFGPAYLERVYTATERSQAGARPEALAALFAAKEAVVKAIGAEDAALAWTDIEVTTAAGAPPAVALTGEAARLAAAAGVRSWTVSMSCAAGLGAAVAVGRTEPTGVRAS